MSLVEILSADDETEPAVIGFAVIYSENVEEEADKEFAQICAAAGSVQ